MLRPRIIVCLLIERGRLIKTQNFQSPKYIGDPLNAVRIFNEKKADELIVLDVGATSKNYDVDFQLIEKLAAECRMPFCYGGGVKSAETAKHLVDMGVEKVAVSSAATYRPALIAEMAESVGSQSVVAVLDIKQKRSLFNRSYEAFTNNGKDLVNTNLADLIEEFQSRGVGEIVVNSIENDGNLKGYDHDLCTYINELVKVPVTFLGGAGSHDDLTKLVKKFGVVGAAAGSLFVFKGKFRAVLINYPTPQEKTHICSSAHAKW